MNDLLIYIDQIDQSVANAEINVLESMIQAYDKSIVILEQCEDVSAYDDIFQEGEKWDKFKEDTKAPVFGKKGEGFVKRLLMIIPRLIQKLIALGSKLFKKNKDISQKMDHDITTLENEAKKTVTQAPTEEQIQKVVSKANEIANERKSDHNITVQSAEEIGKMMNNMKPDETLMFGPNGIEVVKADERKDKTSEYIKDFLDEAGVEIPKIPASEKMLTIDGMSLFWQSSNEEYWGRKNGFQDNDFGLHEEFYATLTLPPELGYSQSGDIYKLNEATEHLTKFQIGYLDRRINQVLKGGLPEYVNGKNKPNIIHVKFIDAIEMMRQMKGIFEDSHKSMVERLNAIRNAIPKLQERQKEIEKRLEDEMMSNDFNPNSMTIKEEKAISDYLAALAAVEMKYGVYCDAVKKRWDAEYRKVVDAIGYDKTYVNLKR